VIVRIVEGVVRSGSESEFASMSRALLRQFGAAPGMRHARMARRAEDDLLRFLWISEWDDMDSLTALVGDPYGPPLIISEHPEFVVSWQVRLFEVFDEPTD
jgi:quinol monooxygenase YgiN